MATGVALSVLVSMVKSHAGLAQVANSALDTEIKFLLDAQQRLFAAQFDWSFLKDHSEDMLVAPGSRYLAIPATIDLVRPISSVWVKWGLYWEELDNGIGPDQYNVYDSDLDQRTDPIQQWRRSGGLEYEIWPIPITAQTVRFYGQKRVDPLVADSSLCDLDADLLALFVAAEYLMRGAQKTVGQLKMTAAQNHFNVLRACEPRRPDPVFGGRDNPNDVTKAHWRGAKVNIIPSK